MDDLINTLETGDILLFNGSYCASRVVKYLTSSEWSHVAIVVKDPNFLINKDGTVKGIYLLESSGTSDPDVDTGKTIMGVQLHEVKDYILDYNGSVSVRRLTCNLTNEEKTDYMKSIYDTLYGKGYDYEPCDLIDIILHNKQINSKFFDCIVYPRNVNAVVCSGLVAYAYTIFGLIKKDTNWSYIAPEYFAKAIDAELQGNATIGPLIKLQ
jgi:hypothetical protein